MREKKRERRQETGESREEEYMTWLLLPHQWLRVLHGSKEVINLRLVFDLGHFQWSAFVEEEIFETP